MAEKTILIIEDNADVQILYAQALRSAGYEAKVASTAREAFDILAVKPLPDLILLDLTLPEMSGTEFMLNLKKNPEWTDIKVIVVSGWDDLRAKAAEMKATGYLRKPFELSKFFKEIETHLS